MKSGIQYNVNITKNEIREAGLDILGAEYDELPFASGAQTVRIGYFRLEEAILDGALEDLSLSGVQVLVIETVGLKTKEEADRLSSLLVKCIPGFKNSSLRVCIENGYVSDGKKIYAGPVGDGVSLSRYIDLLNEKAGEEFFEAAFNIGCARALRLQIKEHIKALAKKIRVLYVSDNDGKEDLRQLPYTFTSVHCISCAGWDDIMDHFTDYRDDIFVIGDFKGTFVTVPKELKAAFLRLAGDILDEWNGITENVQITLPVGE